jgi:hypothetical protein
MVERSLYESVAFDFVMSAALQIWPSSVMPHSIDLEIRALIAGHTADIDAVRDVELSVDAMMESGFAFVSVGGNQCPRVQLVYCNVKHFRQGSSMESCDIESIKKQTRQFVGPDVNIDYINTEFVRETMVCAKNADRKETWIGECITTGHIYGNSLFQIDGVTYWRAENRETDRGGGSGGYSFESSNIVKAGQDGVCPHGKIRFWLEIKDAQVRL